ncbi:MAG: type III pantothenate kinase [Pirellulales bacterium]
MSVVAVDLGNSRMKFARFVDVEIAARGLPTPDAILEVDIDAWSPEKLAAWLPRDATRIDWVVASVNRPALAELEAWLDAARAREKLPAGEVRILSRDDLPLVLRVDHPERVGIDRLLGAVGANRLRAPSARR